MRIRNQAVLGTAIGGPDTLREINSITTNSATIYDSIGFYAIRIGYQHAKVLI